MPAMIPLTEFYSQGFPMVAGDERLLKLDKLPSTDGIERHGFNRN